MQTADEPATAVEPAGTVEPVTAVEPAGTVEPSALRPGGTGEPAADQALDRLAGLVGQPLTEHVAGYEEVHRLLQDALADLDGD